MVMYTLEGELYGFQVVVHIFGQDVVQVFEPRVNHPTHVNILFSSFIIFIMV